MRIEYDPRADALYIYLKEEAEVKESREVESGVTVDYDEKGNPVGIEILDVRKRLSPRDLSRIDLVNLGFFEGEAA